MAGAAGDYSLPTTFANVVFVDQAAISFYSDPYVVSAHCFAYLKGSCVHVW